MSLALVSAVAMTACGSSTADTASTEASTAAEETTEVAEETEATEEAAEEATEETAEGVMSHADFVAADVDTEVTVETYVQAKQGWWENEGVGNASFYTQAEDGAYFLYNMPCTQEEYDQLTQGTKIKVTGYKAEWSGEQEIIDATFEIEDGTYVAEAEDVTALLGSDELADHMNEFVAFKDLTVEAANDNGDAYMYNWDGSGAQGDDLYFNVSDGTNTYSFTVESYLCGADTDVYKAVEALNVGDTVDLEGFLYWYEGANPHITSVTVK